MNDLFFVLFRNFGSSESDGAYLVFFVAFLLFIYFIHS